MALSFFKESRTQSAGQLQNVLQDSDVRVFMERLVTEKQVVEEVELEGARETFLATPHSSLLPYFHIEFYESVYLTL